MSKKKAKNKRNSELRIIFFIILIAALLFIVSTYAWFSTQRNVSITNLSGTVEVAEGLEISLNAKEWYNGIELGDAEGQFDIIDDSYAGNKNLMPSEMLPVSTMGKIGKNMTILNMLRGKVENSTTLKNIAVVDESVTNSENQKFAGYIAFDIFLKNSSKDSTKADILQLNYDSSLQIISADEGGNDTVGLQNTARVAFTKYGGQELVDTDGSHLGWDGVSGVNDGQETVLKNTGAITGGATVYLTDCAIWEPNSNDHVQYIVDNNNKITWSSTDESKYAPLEISDTQNGFDIDTQIPTYALTDTSIGQTITNIYDWSGTDSTIKTQLSKQVVLQTTKTSTTDYTIAEGVRNLISTSDTGTGDTYFTIAPNSISRLRIYVWLEGQDVDCINYASHGGGITLNIGLVKGSTEGTFEPTEEEA